MERREALHLQRPRVLVWAAASQVHPDWDEYDHAMVDHDQVVILIEPGRIYGTNIS